MFSASKAGTPSGGYSISRSVRLRSSASAYFNRTPATATNRKTFTWSGWVKRSNPSTTNTMLAADVDANNFFAIWFREEGDNGRLEILNYSSAYDLRIETTQVFRDVSAWYHVVVAIDTTQATSTNRVKIYINGSQVTALSTTTYPSLNFDTDVNTTNPHTIGVQASSYGLHNGYLTEINFIDGQALTPSSFGVINSYGVWSPIKYSGSYGTNGFYLNFSDNSAATAAAIGKDSSGNGNNWTPNNISLTAGVTYDSMIDSPTTGSGSSNYCVFNPLFTDQIGVASGYGGPAPTISNANLTATATASSLQASAVCTVGVSTGKWYFEYTPSATNSSGDIVGFVCAFSGGLAFAGYRSTGSIYTNGSATAGYATWTAGDVIGIALSIDGSTISAYKNNALQATLSLTTAITNNCFPVIWFRNDAGAGSFNFGQRPFSYTPPSGFLSLNTYNLPTPTISNGASYMAATLYTGTGASLAISNTVNSVSFQPDFVWVKGRSGATDHALYDSVRGTTKDLVSNSTAAEATQATGLTAFGTGGFTVGALAKMNTSSATYVGWQWKAGGAAVSNTAGTIVSQVSANASAGFSVVTYTGTQVNATVGHGLGVAPSMVIVKCISAGGRDWPVYHIGIGNTKYLALNDTVAAGTSASYWNNTSPTSSVFSLGSGGDVNTSAQTLVAYCFSEIAGYSKMGSYTGNGSNDGPFVYTGFRPRFVIVKRTDTTANWVLLDTARDTYNVAGLELFPNLSNAENDNRPELDFLSNGFKLRWTYTGSNASGGTYIYMAFAENPFKYSLAR